ncbi:unnamed protein product, partial [Brassica rapa subsp. trilocularis]
ITPFFLWFHFSHPNETTQTFFFSIGIKTERLYKPSMIHIWKSAFFFSIYNNEV